MELYNCSLYSSRPDYGLRPCFVSDLRDHVGFSSLYQVTRETANAIIEAGTTQGFKGVVWSERLWIDVDSYEAADATESKLKELGHDYIAYDTGGRGAHFGVSRFARPSHLLPQQDRKWVESHFPGADKSIYTHLHPFRLPGTKHEKTGGVKRMVCESKGSTLVLPPFKREQLEAPKASSSQRGSKSIFACYRVIREMKDSPEGRHPNLVRLLYALKDQAGVSKEEAMFWCNEWNKLQSNPKEYWELEKAILSIYV